MGGADWVNDRQLLEGMRHRQTPGYPYDLYSMHGLLITASDIIMNGGQAAVTPDLPA